MEMSTVVRKSSKIISPFLFTYGAYLIIYGHLSPGGGFQGGVILAVGIILLLTSHGYRLVHRTFRERLVKVIESTAALGIVLLGISGLIFQAFFYNYLRGGTPGTIFSGGTIVLFNILVGLKIGTGFTIIFYILLRRMERD
ncbi:MAG: Na(+)/H(+) antiporter subunit B [Candidatus Thermoplasmatota archaeon]